jgi:serine/threonine protein kinase
LKPENVLLLNGTWHLADFGTARFADAETETHTARDIGTAADFAPERWRPERATIAADVYAVGIMAYEMFSGPGPSLVPISGTSASASRLPRCRTRRCRSPRWSPPACIRARRLGQRPLICWSGSTGSLSRPVSPA